MLLFHRNRIFGAALAALLLVFGTSIPVKAQDAPVRPSVAKTTQANPRGSDIVEPALVYLRTAAGDTTFLGTAKIPDPSRGEFGATVNRDLNTGATIRLGGAWIFDGRGVRQSVAFKRGEQLVFRPGPHDDVVSLQGVEPLRREVGREVVFDLQELWASAEGRALSGLTSRTSGSRLRLATLRMQSTYPGGEAVDLNIALEPTLEPVARPIQVVQRDTMVVLAQLDYVVQEEIVQVEESPWGAAMAIETGLGRSSLHSEVPSTRVPSFTDDGFAGSYYVDGSLTLRHGDSRWGLRALAVSSLNHTNLIEMANHQVAVYMDARFEHGTRTFVLMQISGELTDKLHQEFDWNSADYAAEAHVGFGRRFFNVDGFEKSRLEALLGVRMGENRRIEVFEVRGKARGIGPHLTLRSEFSQPLNRVLTLHAGLEAGGYSIFGIGPQDEGFREQGANIATQLKLGRPFLGVNLRAGVTAMWWLRRADLVDDMRYVERRILVAPGISLETYL